MKIIVKFLKIVFLTIITGGLYGAYWIFTNMYRQADYPGIGDSEKKAAEAQDTIALAWMHFINR